MKTLLWYPLNLSEKHYHPSLRSLSSSLVRYLICLFDLRIGWHILSWILGRNHSSVPGRPPDGDHFQHRKRKNSIKLLSTSFHGKLPKQTCQEELTLTRCQSVFSGSVTFDLCPKTMPLHPAGSLENSDCFWPFQ